MSNNMSAPFIEIAERAAIGWLEARGQYACRLQIQMAHLELRRAILKATHSEADDSIRVHLHLVADAAKRIGTLDHHGGVDWPPVEIEQSDFLLCAWDIGYRVAASSRETNAETFAAGKDDSVLSEIFAEIRSLCARTQL